ARCWIEVETRVRAPGRTLRPLLLQRSYAATSWGMSVQTCGGGPEDRAPMEVPDLRAVLPNFEIPLPLRNPLPPSVREPEASRPVSARSPLQSACQWPGRSAPDSTRSCIPWLSITLRSVCPQAFRGCDGCGEARCHRVRGDDTERRTQLNRKRRSAFATVTPGVTLH